MKNSIFKWWNTLSLSNICKHWLFLKKKSIFLYYIALSWAVNCWIVIQGYQLNSLHKSIFPLSRRLKGLSGHRTGLLKDGRQTSPSNRWRSKQFICEDEQVQRWSIKCFAIIRFSKKTLTTPSWDSRWQNLFSCLLLDFTVQAIWRGRKLYSLSLMKCFNQLQIFHFR